MHQGRRGSNKDRNKLGRDTMKKPSPASSAVKKSGGLKRGPWTPEEDELLASFVKRDGEGKWRTLPKRAGLLRCGKSCRLRWMNYLRPTVKRGQIGPDEEDLILRLHRLLGNRWSLIAGRIPGRTDNEIKNYWNTHLSKKLVSQGIDPRTHRPLNPSNHNTPTSTTNNDEVVLTAPMPNPSLEVHETSTIRRNMTHDQNHFYHGNVTNLDGDSFPDDLLSSFLNSFMDEDIFQQQQQQEVNNSINNYSCSSNVCNNGSKNKVIAPPKPYFPAFGDENFWEDAAPSATALGGHDQHMDFVDQFNKSS